MTKDDDLATVLGLLCEVSTDRTDAEQRALLRVCLRLDLDRNKLTTVNVRRREGRPASQLTLRAMGTRELVDDQRQVDLSKADAARLLRSIGKWDRYSQRYAAGVYDDEMQGEQV